MKKSTKFRLWECLWLIYGICAFCLGHSALGGARAWAALLAFPASGMFFVVAMWFLYKHVEARREEEHYTMVRAVSRVKVAALSREQEEHPLLFSEASIDALLRYYERYGDDPEGRLADWRLDLMKLAYEGKRCSPRLLPFVRNERGSP